MSRAHDNFQTMIDAPQFSVLAPSECNELLGRNRVGRLALINGPTVDIEPIGYAAEGDWVYLRSAHGAKLAALAHNPYVAFEVDEVQSPRVDGRMERSTARCDGTS